MDTKSSVTNPIHQAFVKFKNVYWRAAQTDARLTFDRALDHDYSKETALMKLSERLNREAIEAENEFKAILLPYLEGKQRATQDLHTTGRSTS